MAKSRIIPPGGDLESVGDECGAFPSGAGDTPFEGDNSGSMGTIGSAPKASLKGITASRPGRGLSGLLSWFRLSNHHDFRDKVPQPGNGATGCKWHQPARPGWIGIGAGLGLIR